MVEHTVQNHPHTPTVHLLHQFCKQSVTSLQIVLVTGPDLIFRGMEILPASLRQNLTAILHNLPVMGIDIVIILRIVFVVRRGDEQWIKVDQDVYKRQTSPRLMPVLLHLW